MYKITAFYKSYMHLTWGHLIISHIKVYNDEN